MCPHIEHTTTHARTFAREAPASMLMHPATASSDCMPGGMRTPAGVNLGTSIMAVRYEGGVILGADSRTTTGSYIANRVTDKLTPLYDPSIYCCRSGSAADTQALADMVHHYLERLGTEHGEAPSVHTAATLFKKLCYNNKDRLMAGIIVAGWDRLNGGSVYNIPLGGSLHKQNYAIGGETHAHSSSAQRRA